MSPGRILFGLVAFGALLAVIPADDGPPDTSPGDGLDPYAPFEQQTGCDPTEKPGVEFFRALILDSFGGSDGGIVRGCEDGGPSEHKEGRAWDWMIPVGSAREAFLDWLLRADLRGRPNANLRRAGVMYVISNRRIWRAYRPAEGWQPYAGSNPHIDHVHLSFSRAGAAAQTSLYAPGAIA